MSGCTIRITYLIHMLQLLSQESSRSISLTSFPTTTKRQKQMFVQCSGKCDTSSILSHTKPTVTTNMQAKQCTSFLLCSQCVIQEQTVHSGRPVPVAGLSPLLSISVILIINPTQQGKVRVRRIQQRLEHFQRHRVDVAYCDL